MRIKKNKFTNTGLPELAYYDDADSSHEFDEKEQMELADIAVDHMDNYSH